MTPEQMGDLLGACATFDRRTVGETDVIAWMRVLGDLNYDECEAAVIAHYAESREWIMPADIRRRVRISRRHLEDREHLRTQLDPAAYRVHVAAADNAFMRKLAGRTSTALALKAPPEPDYDEQGSR